MNVTGAGAIAIESELTKREREVCCRPSYGRCNQQVNVIQTEEVGGGRGQGGRRVGGWGWGVEGEKSGSKTSSPAGRLVLDLF